MKLAQAVLLWVSLLVGVCVAGCDDENETDATPTPEPVVSPLADGECRDIDDCDQNGESCDAPDDPGSCGICREVKAPCTEDSECDPQTTGQVCQAVICACSPASECVPGCTTTGCDEGTTCNGATERCEPNLCEVWVDCPASFSCINQACARTTCEDDGVCQGGYCVKGRCFGEPGTCQLPVP